MYTLQNYSTINIYFTCKINPKGKVFQLYFSIWLEFQTDWLFQNRNRTFEASAFLECFFPDSNNLITKYLDSLSRSVLCKVKINNSKYIHFFFNQIIDEMFAFLNYIINILWKAAIFM